MTRPDDRTDRPADGSIIGIFETADDLYLPAADACASSYCGRPAAEHRDTTRLISTAATRLDDDAILHAFVAPARQPRPERIAEAHITTQWTCTACGSECDVWGVGDGWLDCTDCGKSSFVV